MQREEVSYDYDAIPPGYYDEVFRRGRGMQSKWHHLKFKYIRSRLPEGYTHHLDIGCGSRTFVGTLNHDSQSIGTDVADPQIQYAPREYKTDSHDFRTVKPGPLPFEDESFDVVTLIGLIEHIDMPTIDALLGEARRVLKPGGTALITTPNYASLWPLLETIVNARAKVTYEDQHITFFNRKTLRELLRRSGFGDCSATTFQGTAFSFAALAWKISDAVQVLEDRLLSYGTGFLLLGTGRKQ